MREKDLKILWGRSGNRCALCKLELTPDGNRETLGEMAHIVGRSKEGPRGSDPLPSEDRDRYSNLILLCPTHHREIDKNHEDWPAHKLKQIKSEHESWVTEMLQQREITVSPIDNSEFLHMRLERWKEFCSGDLGLATSLSPLRVNPDQIDALGDAAQRALESARVAGIGYERTLNRHKTRPSEYGLCNERLPNPDGLDGYSFHIFSSGHCEVVYALGSAAARFAADCEGRQGDYHGASRLLRYTDFAERMVESTRWLEGVWKQLLPFEYLDFRVHALSTAGLTIYAHEDEWRFGVFGYPATSPLLVYQEILSLEEFLSGTTLPVLEWLSQCFGLQLLGLYDENNKLMRPIPFR